MHPLRLLTAGALLVLILSSLLAARAEAAPRVEVGYARFDASGGFDSRSDGAELRVAWPLRGPFELDVGYLDQHGEISLPFLPGATPRHDWRALFAGPRATWTLGGRWTLSTALALAHVDDERATPVFGEPVDGAYPTPIGQHVVDRSTLGGMASVGLGFAISERQSLRLDLRRLHAGIGQRCEIELLGPGQSFVDCSHVGYRSVDGLALSWGWTFR